MMTTLKFHPIANVLPLIEGEDFDRFAADVEANGLKVPIMLYEEQILDGRSRYRACLAKNVEPRFQQYDGSDPIAFVISLNLHRRHPTLEQRAMAAAQFALLRLGDVKSQRKQKDDHGGSADPPRPQCSLQEAADLVGGVSRESVKRAHLIATKGTPEEIERVKTGHSSLARVSAIIRKRESKPKRGKMSKADQQRTAAQAAGRITQERADMWAVLRKGLDSLTSLPRAADVAEMVSKVSKVAPLIDAKLGRARNWLREFEDEWRRRRTDPPATK